MAPLPFFAPRQSGVFLCLLFKGLHHTHPTIQSPATDRRQLMRTKRTRNYKTGCNARLTHLAFFFFFFFLRFCRSARDCGPCVTSLLLSRPPVKEPKKVPRPFCTDQMAFTSIRKRGPIQGTTSVSSVSTSLFHCFKPLHSPELTKQYGKLYGKLS